MLLSGETIMELGKKAKPISPEEMAAVHHALESPIRRNMLILMNQGVMTVPDLARAAGEKMLEYQLHRLELAGLIELERDKIILTEAGVAYGELVKKEKELGGADKI
jgi:predicted DNA-binding ArsR family transcriptional regulator